MQAWLDWLEDRLGAVYTTLFAWATDFPALALTLLWLAVVGGCVLLSGCAVLWPPLSSSDLRICEGLAEKIATAPDRQEENRLLRVYQNFGCHRGM